METLPFWKKESSVEGLTRGETQLPSLTSLSRNTHHSHLQCWWIVLKYFFYVAKTAMEIQQVSRFHSYATRCWVLDVPGSSSQHGFRLISVLLVYYSEVIMVSGDILHGHLLPIELYLLVPKIVASCIFFFHDISSRSVPTSDLWPQDCRIVLLEFMPIILWVCGLRLAWRDVPLTSRAASWSSLAQVISLPSLAASLSPLSSGFLSWEGCCYFSSSSLFPHLGSAGPVVLTP